MNISIGGHVKSSIEKQNAAERAARRKKQNLVITLMELTHQEVPHKYYLMLADEIGSSSNIALPKEAYFPIRPYIQTIAATCNINITCSEKITDEDIFEYDENKKKISSNLR